MMKAQQLPKRTGWQTVKENVEHPDHEGVFGDLIQNENGSYLLLVYTERLDNYVQHSVPHKWARTISP
jgi:hypothetical protein